MVILDTDHLSFLQHPDSRQANVLRTKLSGLNPQEVGATIVSFEEQVRGWMSYLNRARSMIHQIEAYSRLALLLENYRTISVILPFDAQAAVEFQRIRQHASRIGTMDLKIAAIALAHQATLLSRNLADFQRVPGLHVEDWTI